METRTLTPKQIEDLHEFCYFRSVSQYEVQVEIVDHLASSIEKLWETNPELPFDEAMYLVDEQFDGNLGFETIKKEKEKALRKKYWRLLWKFAGDYYKFPKIMITLLLSLGLFSAFRLSENNQWITVPLIVLFVAISLFYRLYFFPTFVEIKITKGYSFLLYEVARIGLRSKTELYIIILLFVFAKHQIHFSTLTSILLSVLIPLYFVMLYGDYFFISKKIREHFIEQYPQFIIS